MVVSGDENGVRLEVRNTGAPIEPAAMQDLFEFRKRGVPPEKRANSNGLGLGLYIVREITQAHGGEVEVRSEGAAAM